MNSQRGGKKDWKPKWSPDMIQKPLESETKDGLRMERIVKATGEKRLFSTPKAKWRTKAPSSQAICPALNSNEMITLGKVMYLANLKGTS